MDIANPMEIIPAPATLPAIITRSGPAAPERFLEFFAANIRNPNTHRAYARQVMQFLAWCEGRSVTRAFVPCTSLATQRSRPQV